MTARSDSEDIDRKLAQLEREVASKRAAPSTVPSPAYAPPGQTFAARPAAAAAPAQSAEESRWGWRTLIGLLLIAFGAYGVLSNVTVTSGAFGGFLGGMLGSTSGGGFGWLLLPIVAGIALVVARQGIVAKTGWLLIVAGILFIFAQVLGSMRIWFRPVDLPILLLMFAPIGVGLGLILSDALRRPAGRGSPAGTV